MKKISIFHFSLIAGLSFVIVGIFFAYNDPGARWYLIGQGQIMLAVGFIGLFVTRKKKGEE